MGHPSSRDAYLRFNIEGFTYDWHVTVQQVVGEGQHAASWPEFTGPEGTQPGLCFFDLDGDGLITIAASGAILALKLTLGLGVLALVVHLLTH